MKLFAIFHLNLMFSSIPEESRPEVIRRCYHPLLKLIEEHRFPLGIEASGITLEIIRDLDPAWIDKFKSLLQNGQAEFIGSGYGQIIGPLVPPSVTRANLRIGHMVSQEILGLKPAIALVNEQAWSAGLAELYLEAGYRAIFMDYDNPARFSGWEDHIQHYPQRAKGVNGESIPVLWSRSMVFQKLQRFAHGELELPEYLEYIENIETGDGWLPVYGNDAEIFDFRPRRYHTEAVQETGSEWDMVRLAFESLRDRGHTFHLPSLALHDLDQKMAGHKLHLSCPDQPVPVKKQSKYNITRWAVSGRNDFHLNSLCRAVCKKLEQEPFSDESCKDWKELCYCWSSDFRTHITDKRYDSGLERLKILAAATEATVQEPYFKLCGTPAVTDGRMLKIETPSASVTLNAFKGLAIQQTSFTSHDLVPSFGTLDHGYFKDIDLGADFFSGHVIMEGPGSPRDTDLAKIIPLVEQTDSYIQAACSMNIHRGTMEKAVRVYKDKEQIDILYRFDLDHRPTGFMRLGHVTLLTGAMDPAKLFYRTCNGGRMETFPLKDLTFDHSSHISFLVSSSQAVGMTDSKVIIGGAERSLEISSICPEHAFIAMVKCRQTEPSPFVRVFFSMQEMDETSCRETESNTRYNFSTGFSIKPYLEDRQDDQQ